MISHDDMAQTVLCTEFFMQRCGIRVNLTYMKYIFALSVLYIPGQYMYWICL